MIKNGVVLIEPTKYDIVLETAPGASRQEIIAADGYEIVGGLIHFYHTYYEGDDLPYSRRVFYILNEQKLIDMKIERPDLSVRPHLSEEPDTDDA